MDDDWFCTPGFPPSYVRRVRVPPGVMAIRDQAFRELRWLMKVDLNEVSIIGGHAFQLCTALQTVSLPSVTEIGTGAFSGCSALKTVELREGITQIESRAFEDCEALERIAIPSSVKKIDRWTFARCTNLAELELRDGLQTIEQTACWNCCELRSLTVPSSVSDIGQYAFQGCTKMGALDLGNGLRTIDRGAFSGCGQLTKVVIPSTVAIIGEGVFGNCAKLAEVEVGAGSILEIGHGAFLGCRLGLRFHVPSRAFVISVGAARHTLECRLSRDATISSTDPVRMIVSKCVEYMGPTCLVEAEIKINAILGRLGLTNDTRPEQIRALFNYYELVQSTTMLELAVWKAAIDGGGTHGGLSRQACRVRCGKDINVIVTGALRYL